MYQEQFPLIIFNTSNKYPNTFIFVITGSDEGDYKIITQKLLDDFSNYRKVVLYKTAPQKENETFGVDGYFIDEERFSRMVADGDLLFYEILPDKNFEGLTHKHASDENEWGRPLVHCCNSEYAETFKNMLGENCCVIYLNNTNTTNVNPIMENATVVNFTDLDEELISKLKTTIEILKNA
ncbi:MAG: hypothetical protein ACR2IQ_00965 [Minisyncoccia bacterium]